MRGAEILPLKLADLAILAQIVLEHPVLLALGLGVIGIVDVHREIAGPRARRAQPYAFGVGQAGMLDRVDPGPDRALDPLGAMGMGRDTQAPLIGFFRDGAQLALGQLRLPRLGIAREHPAGGADLDHLGTELALAADLVAQFVGAVGDPLLLLGLLEAGGQEGRIAVTAGGADRIARGNDPGADRIAIVDRLLQSDVVAVGGADVAHGGEAGVEHRAPVADRGHGKEAVGKFQVAIAADVGRAVEVDVHVDEARQQRPVAKVDVANVAPPAHRARVGNTGDTPVVADEDGGKFDHPSGLDVDHPRGGDDDLFGLRGGGGEHRCQGPESRANLPNLHTHDHRFPPFPWLRLRAARQALDGMKRGS